MGKIASLRRFPLLTTKNIEEAEVAISKSLSDVTVLNVDQSAPFHLQINGVGIGRSSLAYNFFGSATKLRAGLPEDFLYLIFSGDKPTSFHLGKDQVTISSQKAAVIMPEKLTFIERTKNSECLSLRVPRLDLLQYFEKVTGRHHSGSLSFENSVDLTSGNGAVVKRMLDYITEELDYNEKILTNPGYVESFGQMLLSAILSLPHNKSTHLKAQKGTTTAPGIVHRAEEYMKAYLDEAISITDLLRISNCSRSVLFSSFQNARNYTPMEFLTEQRLQHARENLLHPREADTVSSIGVDSGFFNLGRFSQMYGKRFGERPSVTLRKSEKK